MALMTSLKSTVLGFPLFFSGESRGFIKSHCLSVKSEGYAFLSLPISLFYAISPDENTILDTSSLSNFTLFYYSISVCGLRWYLLVNVVLFGLDRPRAIGSSQRTAENTPIYRTGRN